MGAKDESSEKAKASKERLFTALRCPNPDCRQLLFEVDGGFWTESLEKMPCRKCGQETIAELYSLAEDEPGKLTIRFWCKACMEDFDRSVPGIRKYCRGCKNYYVIFLSLLLGVAHLVVTSRPGLGGRDAGASESP